MSVALWRIAQETPDFRADDLSGGGAAKTGGRWNSVGKAVVHGLFAFIRSYVIRRGFLDGQHGLMLAIYNAEYAYYKYIKLMFLQTPATRPEFPA